MLNRFLQIRVVDIGLLFRPGVHYCGWATVGECSEWVVVPLDAALRFPVEYAEALWVIFGESHELCHIFRALGKVLLVIFPGRQTNELGAVTGGRDWHRFGAVS